MTMTSMRRHIDVVSGGWTGRTWGVTISAAILAMLIPAGADAHMVIAPSQSTAGATEKYVVRVPTEGKVATVAAELEVPEGAVVEAVAVPAGWKHEIKRKGDRIVAITWTMDIPPGEFAEFASWPEIRERGQSSCGPCVSVLRTVP